MARYNLLKRLLVILAISTVSLTGVSNPYTGQFKFNDTIYRVRTPFIKSFKLAETATQIARMGYDVSGVNHETGEIEVVTNLTGVRALEQRGYSGIVLREAVNRVDPRFLNPTTLEAKMRALNQAYPTLTRLEQIGRSVQGRPIYALLISNTPAPNDPAGLAKPSIIFDGLHHAREVMTPEVVLDVAETLLSSTRRSPRAAQVVSTWMTWVVPMVNVDGSNIVHTADNMWRKNARADARGVHGVDINRNYQYRWNGCGGSSGSKGAQDYRGTAPGSEPETQALMNLVNNVRPTASLSYHSFSELVLYSYGCRGALTGDAAMVERIAKELAAQLPTDSGKGFYTPGAPWQILYDVDGDSMDHIYASVGALSYTFEVNQSFQPSYDLRGPTLVKHRKAWMYFYDRMDKNMLTVAAVDSQRKPIVAEIVIDKVPHKFGELPFRTNNLGRFFKVLDPGEYIISAKAQNGKTVQVKVQMKGAPQGITLTF